MVQPLKYRNARGEMVTVEPIPAEALKNAPGTVLDQAASGRAVVVTRRSAPRAVIISIEDFQALARDRSPGLAELEGRFDSLLASMQTKKSKEGVAALFGASPKELGKAAVAAARKTRTRRAG
ncbi:MAG TPA: type II toxin-antitoxin system Phd/YefM family antitoxin [Usitatibacter sp.]|nr:type II toxin-antitoxin system Phd/YefM family antitoxin [Usitatibacter sp.]